MAEVYGIQYQVEFENVSVSVAQDFFALNPDAAGEVIIPTSAHIFNASGVADIGDTEEEFLRVAWQRAAAVGSGGSASTPHPVPAGMPASAITARINDTTEAATPTIIEPLQFNVRQGLDWRPIPGEFYGVAGGVTNDVLVLSLLAAPADAIILSGWVKYIELRF